MGAEAEAAPAGAPKIAPIKIFISGNSGNKEIETRQQRIVMILKSLNIPMQLTDISAPGMEEQRDFMRGSAKKQEGQRNVLPPQIFNVEKYCGDYDDFDVANEDDELEEFLGIPRKTPKAVPAGEPAPKEEVEPAPATEDPAPAAEDSATPTEAEAPPTEAEAPSAEPEVPTTEPEEAAEES